MIDAQFVTAIFMINKGWLLDWYFLRNYLRIVEKESDRVKNFITLSIKRLMMLRLGGKIN